MDVAGDVAPDVAPGAVSAVSWFCCRFRHFSESQVQTRGIPQPQRRVKHLVFHQSSGEKKRQDGAEPSLVHAALHTGGANDDASEHRTQVRRCFFN